MCQPSFTQAANRTQPKTALAPARSQTRSGGWSRRCRADGFERTGSTADLGVDVVGMVDDDPMKLKKRIGSITVFGTTKDLRNLNKNLMCRSRDNRNAFGAAP